MQQRKPKPQMYWKSNVYNFFTSLGWPLSVLQIKTDFLLKTLLYSLQSWYSSDLIALLLTALKATSKLINRLFKPEILWALSLRLQTFNISYLSLHLKSCVSMWCANKQTKKRKHVKRSWHVKISRMLKVSIAFTRCNTKQEIVWKFAGALIMPQIHCYVVLYIRLWMWALQVPAGLRAVGWILLQHQYLQCWQLIAAPACLKRPWPAELWTLYHVHWTFTSLLHWSAV